MAEVEDVAAALVAVVVVAEVVVAAAAKAALYLTVRQQRSFANLMHVEL